MEQGTGRERTCVSACNSYLQFKCLPGPISAYRVCVCSRVCVDGALPNGRPQLNIKVQTGDGLPTKMGLSAGDTDRIVHRT